jgi:cytochrome c553
MNKTALTILASACLAFGAGSAMAAGDAAAGLAKSESCANCHGEDGKGDDSTPGIAGMKAADFEKMIGEYASGAKKSPMMNKIAKKLSPQDIADLAAHYASLK